MQSQSPIIGMRFVAVRTEYHVLVNGTNMFLEVWPSIADYVTAIACERHGVILHMFVPVHLCDKLEITYAANIPVLNHINKVQKLLICSVLQIW